MAGPDFSSGTSAQHANFSNFSEFVNVLLNLVYLLIPVVASLSLLVFFWGLTKFIMSAGSQTAVKDGKNLMIWGTIALFVMVSIWGIIRFAQGDLELVTSFGLPLLPK